MTMIRVATDADGPALVALWQQAGLRFAAEQVPRELAALLRRDHGLVLVAEDEEGLAAAVLGTYDGRRGWVNRLATRPGRRGQGLAAALLASLEARLAGLGCHKINLLIEPDNRGVVPFYERLGYSSDELLFMEKWLPAAAAGQPPGAPGMPGPDGEAGREQQRTALLAGLQPWLDPAEYVFIVASEVPPGLRPFAVITEEEGLTLVLPRAEAAAHGLTGGWPAARITLGLQSALTAVGLTAAISARLAAAGISCNVIAGYHHDHLFVPLARGREARRLLAS